MYVSAIQCIFSYNLKLITYNLQLLLLLFQREFAGGEAVVVAEELYGVVAGGEGGVYIPVDFDAAYFLSLIFDGLAGCGLEAGSLEAE